MNPQDAKKLHLGCGNIRLPGFCNVDILNTIAVDVVSDISKLDNFSNNSIELIYACHVLEHFSHEEVKRVLSRWYQVLSPGGEHWLRALPTNLADPTQTTAAGRDE